MRTIDRNISARPARFRAGLLCCLLFSAGMVLAQDQVAAGRPGGDTDAGFLQVEIRGDLVTLRAHEARIRDLLTEIVRQSDLSVVSHASLDERISLELERMPLNEVLVTIMRGQSYMLYNSPAANSASDTLWVFSDASSDGSGYSLSASSLAIEVLRAQLRSDDIRVRQDAIKALRGLDVNAAVGPLSDALADENKKIRVKAVYALADIGGDDAMAVLAAGLADENAWVRAETAYALGALGSDSAIPLLKHALHDQDAQVRESAISAFTEIGGNQSAEALAVALQDTDPQLRVEAIEALRNVGGETAVRLLNSALQDQDNVVREAAREAFAGLSRQQNL